MSLRQELMHDLFSDEEEDDQQYEDTPAAAAPDGDGEEDEAPADKRGKIGNVRSVANLMNGLEPVLEAIQYYKALPEGQQTTNVGNVDDNPEYKLLTEANTVALDIDGEIMLVHKFIRDHYSKRFPELEVFVNNPIDYAKSVAIIGNGPMTNFRVSDNTDNIVGQSLKDVLTGPNVMVVTMGASDTKGELLTDEELEIVIDGCKMQLKLDEAKRLIADYVRSRLNIFAPNLTTLIGSLTAAQLLSVSGGVKGLASTPNKNLIGHGNRQHAATVGLAKNIGVRNQGYLYHNDLVQAVPQELRAQAMKILSGKVVLAARIDLARTHPDGQYGFSLADDVTEKLLKLGETPLGANARALKAPDEKLARKRGGRAARAKKASEGMTDLRKEQNRMTFGQEENEIGYGDEMKGLGMIGQQDNGHISSLKVDKKTAAKLSKKSKGWGGAPLPKDEDGGAATSLGSFGGDNSNGVTLQGAGLRASGVGGGMKTQVGNGASTSLAFGGKRGLELIDPRSRDEASKKRKAEEDRYFSSGVFTALDDKSASQTKKDSQGFAIPPVPAPKKKKDESSKGYFQ